MSVESMRKIKGHGVGERAVIGRLKRLGGRAASSGEIVFCDGGVGADEISSLSDEVSGVVVAGAHTEGAAVAVRARGLSAVFIDAEDAAWLTEGERAVIYPERDMLFLAPRLEIVDDFSTRMRAEIENEPCYSQPLIECRELFSGKVGMLAISGHTLMRGEEAAFETYKRAAEECELRRLLILLNHNEINAAEQLRTEIRAVIRAAVYTKITLAVSVRSILEYERVCASVRGISKELREAGGEIPDGVSVGVIIRDAREVVCIEEYSRAADIILLDAERLVGDVCDGERTLALEGYLRVMMGRMSFRVRDVVIMGDNASLEACSQILQRENGAPERSYFLMDHKNIK